MHYMERVHGASCFVPEMDVSYWIESKMCDYIMHSKDGVNIGVSVTRAISYPFETPFTLERARTLLERKLYGLVVARNCVSECHSFDVSVLHTWCLSRDAAEQLRIAHSELAQADREERTYDNIHVACTVCTQLSVYNNRL